MKPAARILRDLTREGVDSLWLFDREKKKSSGA
jgi:hypothetical protein